MKLNTILSFSIAALISLAIDLPVKADTLCEVTDPTGTPLNVRDSPNGRVVNALRNGREVYILDIAYDRRNRPWAKVGGYYQGEYRIWGWVFREFISCYKPTSFLKLPSLLFGGSSVTIQEDWTQRGDRIATIDNQ